MASRMEKYYIKQLQTKNRSQKNQLLYQKIDISNDNTDDFNLSRAERIFENYENYKHGKKETRVNKETYYDDYNYNHLELTKRRDKFINDISQAEDRRIRELIDIINRNSILNSQRKLNQTSPSNLPDLSEKTRILFDNTENNTFVESSKTLNSEDEMENNLRIKIIVGAIFIINTVIIILLIYRKIV